ncbi:hypothetical protein BGZ83_002242 [Gryganskiella cystojenkinii]|nr:hypothetical protein BGZ83_002242 [Gryganskiella cystojenkinii]
MEDAAVLCSNSDVTIASFPNILSGGDSWTIPGDVLSSCGNGNNIYVKYSGQYYDFLFFKDYFSTSCGAMTIQQVAPPPPTQPTPQPPSPTPTSPLSTTTVAALPTVTTTMTSVTLTSSITSLLAPTLLVASTSTDSLLTSPTTAVTTTGNNEASSKSSSNSAAVAGGAIGGIAAVAAVLFGLVVVRRRQQRNRSRLPGHSGEGYQMRDHGDSFDGGYGFGRGGRGYVHSTMMSDSGTYGYSKSSQNYDYSYGNNNDSSADYFSAASASHATGQVGGGGGGGKTEMSEYMPPPPPLIPAAVRLPTRPEPSYSENFGDTWDQPPVTSGPMVGSALTDVDVTTTTGADYGAGAATQHLDGYGLENYAYEDDQDPYCNTATVTTGPLTTTAANRASDSKNNTHVSVQSFNDDGLTDQDYFRRLRQSIASTAAGGPNRDSLTDGDIFPTPTLPSPGFGLDGFTFPVPPSTTAPSFSTTVAVGRQD